MSLVASTLIASSLVTSLPVTPSLVVSHSAESRGSGSSQTPSSGSIDGSNSQTTSLVVPICLSIHVTQNTHHMVTKSKAGVYKPKAYTTTVSAT